MTHVLDAQGRIKEYWGELALADLSDYGQGRIIYGGAVDWQALAHPGAANRVLQSTAAEVAWSANTLVIEANSIVNQDLTTDAGVTFADVFVPDGGTFGIAGNELLTVNAAGTFAFSGILGITVEDDDWIGLGAAKGRIEFDDQATDEVNFIACFVGIGTQTPTVALEINAAYVGAKGQIVIDNAGHKAINFYTGATQKGYVWYDDGNSRFNIQNANGGSYGDLTLNAVGGNVVIGATVAGGKLEVDQAAAGGAIPCLVLDQADVDEPYIEFQSATLYTARNGADEYVMVKNSAGATRYLRLYEDP